MGQILSATFRGSFAAESIVNGTVSAALQNEIFDAATSGQVEQLIELLETSGFDLTTLDESTGETLLHRALASEQNDVVLMLLDRADDDPLILDAQDREGYTPLMRATAQHNVPMMQSLVERGARSDDSVAVPDLNQDSEGWLEMSREEPQRVLGTPDFLSLLVASVKRNYDKQLSECVQETVDANVHAITAQMLVDARGNLQRAFELAVERKSAGAAKFYFDARKNTVPPMREGTVGYTNVYDVLAALLWTDQSAGQNSVEAVTSYTVVNTLLRDYMRGQSDRAKIAALKRMIDAAGPAASKLPQVAADRCRRNEPAQAWTEHACDSFHFGHLRLLIAAGVRCDPLLIDVFKSAPLAVLQKFGAMAIDCHTMVTLVRECIGGPDAPQKIAVLVPGVLKGLFDADGLSEQETLAALRELPLKHARPAVTQIMLDFVKNKRMAAVGLLIEAGAPTIDVLGELAKAEDRSALRKCIRMGANPFAAMVELLARGEREAARQLGVAMALEYGPAGAENPRRGSPSPSLLDGVALS